MKEQINKIENKIRSNIDQKRPLFKVFDQPRPKYITKVTVIDKAMNKLLLWIIPDFIKPNYITFFRLVSIPFIIYLLLVNDYKSAFVLFIFSAFSDVVDGSLARTRNQITNFGIIFDPLVDKLLVGSAGGILIFKFLNPAIALIVIILEIILIVSTYYRYKGEALPAKTVGKIKMILQCFGVGFIFLFLITGNVIFLTIAMYILYLAIIFAILSILIYKSI